MEHHPEKVITISTRTLWNVAAFGLLLTGLYYLRDLVYVVLTSIVIASFVEFGVKKLAVRKLGRSFSVLLIYFCVIAFFGLFLYFFVPVFLGQMAQFYGFVQEYLPTTHATSVATEVPFADIIGKFEAIAMNAGSGVIQIASLVFGGLLNIVLLIVISFYLSINKDGVENFLRVIIPDHNEEYAVSLWKRTEHKIGLWFQGQLLLGVVVGVMIYIGLLLFGVKYSLLLAIAAAILELIPFGIILAAVPAIASGYVSGGTTTALEVTGLYVLVQQIEASIIQPLVVKKVVGISSLVVILSILIGVKLAGFWGVILSIPVAVCLMEYFEDLDKKKKAAIV
jgi:predicted PurR-regulated permease PerM